MDDETPSDLLLSKAKNDAADVSSLLHALRDELKRSLILVTVIDVAIAKIWGSIEGITEVLERDYPDQPPKGTDPG